MQSKYDQSLCYYRENTILAETDIFGKTNSFTYTNSSTNSFTYDGLEINHQSDTTEVSQKTFVDSLSFIPQTQKRQSQKYNEVNQEEETIFVV